ncbi:Methyltransferase domain-containing protein [Nitrosospira multiformis]|uniref:Methyltransferase domain-containing protein n=1 Tax=Nitrosospira multiformis TaxID=1231 RepID=A0A1H8DTH1_9PROT|nr:class I SAM-dependent methyltransferase [Nitrosospira multiformis]SEN10520.1 Methyltransferase domain-containing protein [Nitrosospira multiformis]
MKAEKTPSSSKTYYDEPRDEMVRFVPTSVKRLLDVGCGQGAFGVSLLQTHSQLQIWGIEPFADAAEVARQRLAKVINTTIENALESLPEQYFDCVVFNDSLEHLVDPWEVLSKLRPKLTQGAKVVASIPNVRYFWVIKQLLQEGDFQYGPWGVLDKTHLRFFTQKSMQRLFIESGYSIDQIEGIRPITFPWKFGLLNLLCRKSLEDARYERFTVLASPVDA